MRRPALASFALAAAVLAFAFPPRALAKPPSLDLDAWVRESSLVVDAKAIAVEGPRGRFEVLRVLKGTLADRELAAAPVATHACVGPRDQAPFAAGDEVVLFLLGRFGQEDFRPAAGGAAWWPLRAAKRTEILEAVSKVVEFEALPSAEARLRAYFGAVEGTNATLRFAARRVLETELGGKDRFAPWEDRLVALLRSPVPDARVAGIFALRFSNSPKALPALLDAVRDGDPGIREAACMALGPYDTEVSVRALLDAAERPGMAPRVLNHLRGSRRPEAWVWLAGLLDSEDPDLRGRALGALEVAVRNGDPQVARIHALLDDPSPEVRHAALRALHWSPLPDTQRLVIGRLRKADLDPLERAAATRCLCRHGYASSDPGEARRILREIEDLPALLAASLKEGGDGGEEVLQLLAEVGTKAARAILERAGEGEFGPRVAAAAKRWRTFVGPPK